MPHKIWHALFLVCRCVVERRIVKLYSLAYIAPIVVLYVAFMLFCLQCLMVLLYLSFLWHARTEHK